MTNLNKTIEALNRNGFKVTLFDNKESLVSHIYGLVQEGESVGFGGSVTLRELGLYDGLIKRGHDCWWHWVADDKTNALAHAVESEVYLSSANAITEEGYVVNRDGTGNRVSNLTLAHRLIVIVAGTNKLVKDVPAALERITTVAAPLNGKRLKIQTPCAVKGVCTDCYSADRMCNYELIMRRAAKGANVHVLLVDEAMGY